MREIWLFFCKCRPINDQLLTTEYWKLVIHVKDTVFPGMPLNDFNYNYSFGSEDILSTSVLIFLFSDVVLKVIQYVSILHSCKMFMKKNDLKNVIHLFVEFIMVCSRTKKSLTRNSVFCSFLD